MYTLKLFRITTPTTTQDTDLLLATTPTKELKDTTTTLTSSLERNPIMEQMDPHTANTGRMVTPTTIKIIKMLLIVAHVWELFAAPVVCCPSADERSRLFMIEHF
jgi:hypothetical protein